MRIGSASVVEYINESLLPERPLNYYVNIRTTDERAFDMLIGAAMARSLDMRKKQPKVPARIYTPCPPNDVAMLRNLQSFGFQNDDAEIRMRLILQESKHAYQPPVGCVIEPVSMADERDMEGFLQRVNRVSLTSRSLEWIYQLRQAQLFTVYGVWQDARLLGELVITAYGSEAHIEMLYTRPEFRRRGVARALIQHTSNRLLRQGIRTLNAEVWRRNVSAMELFQSMRFDSVSPIVLYPGIDLS